MLSTAAYANELNSANITYVAITLQIQTTVFSFQTTFVILKS